MKESEIRFNEIKNTIKIWPYLDGLSQAIFPYSNRHLSGDMSMIVNLDFSNVINADSSGLAIALKKLITLFLKDEKSRHFNLVPPKNNDINDFLSKTGFYYILDSYLHFGNKIDDLFKESPQFILQEGKDVVINNELGLVKTSFPLFRLKYNHEDDRESLQEFSNWLDDIIFKRLEEKYKIKIDVLFSVLTEIAKNSVDHTEKDAFWGFDIVENPYDGDGKLFFSCSDLGNGIAQTVRDYLSVNPTNQLRADVVKHGSLTDYYKWAFTLGNSTSKNKNNKGIGMTMIIDGVHELKMDLSFFDARSMMHIPESLFYTPNALNHEELRRKAWNTENKVGFYYYGKLKLSKK